MACRKTNIVSNDEFVAYIKYLPFHDCAVVTVHARPEGDKYGVDFSYKVAEYETATRGASASARKQINLLKGEKK